MREQWNGTRWLKENALAVQWHKTHAAHMYIPAASTKGGWTLCLKLTLDLDETWLKETDTDPDLLDCIMEYAHGRGDQTMEDIDAKAFAHKFKKWQQHSMR